MLTQKVEAGYFRTNDYNDRHCEEVFVFVRLDIPLLLSLLSLFGGGW